MSERFPRAAIKPITLALLVGGLAFALAVASIGFTSGFGRVAAIWPANAVVVAALLRADRRRWPLITAAGVIGIVGASLLNASSLWPALALPLCNGLDIVICAAGVRMSLGPAIDLARGRHLLVFALAAGLIAPLASAIPAAWLLGLARHGDYVTDLIAWFGAKGLGVLVLTPALLAITPTAVAGLFSRGRAWRTLGLFGLLAICLAAVLLQTRFPLTFLIMPVLMLITFQLELIGGALAVLITAVAAVSLSVLGLGPATLVRGDLLSRLALVQVFLAITTLSVLGAAAVLARQRRLTEAAQASLTETRAAQALAMEHQRWAAMAEEIGGVGHWRYDTVNKTTLWSDEIFRIYGLDSADGIPNLADNINLYHPDDRDLVSANFVAAIREGRPFAADIRVVRPNGEVRNVTSRGAAERGPDGKICAVFGAFMDVTDVKRAERELRDSEERFRLLADKSNDIIMQTTIGPGYSRRLKYISPAVQSVLGFGPGDYESDAITMEYVHPDDVDALLQSNLAQIAEGPGAVPRTNTYRTRHKDGRWVWLEGKPTFTFDPKAGVVCGMVTVMRDVTAQKAAEFDLASAREAAEAASIAKSDFMANMSHEIRTPLTAIIGFSGLLDQAEQLPESARRYVKRIVDGGHALLSVVNDILDFSKLEAGQVELDPHPFNLSAIVNEAVQLVAAQAASKGLDLKVRLGAAVPAMIEADSARLKQVLLNLLTNAIKFTSQGGVTITADYLAADGRLQVQVIDTGLGIPADKRDRLFERFSQVDASVNRRYGGSGLGLAICKNLVEMMGGDIGVKSEEGVGSTFSFTIAAPVTAAAQRTDARSGAPALDVANAEAARILVVDDVAENRELVRTLLEAIGHEVDEAETGFEAVRAAIGQAYDLILMDMQMPGMDGLAATRAIRATAELNHDTPILALSANVMANQIAQCHAAGMNDHIAKPIQLADLLSKVTRWTSQTGAGSLYDLQNVV